MPVCAYSTKCASSRVWPKASIAGWLTFGERKFFVFNFGCILFRVSTGNAKHEYGTFFRLAWLRDLLSRCSTLWADEFPSLKNSCLRGCWDRLNKSGEFIFNRPHFRIPNLPSVLHRLRKRESQIPLRSRSRNLSHSLKSTDTELYYPVHLFDTSASHSWILSNQFRNFIRIWLAINTANWPPNNLYLQD